MATDHCGRSAGAQRQGGELGEEIRHRCIGRLEPLESALLGVTAALAVNDQGVIDLAGFDHRPGKLQRIQEPEASVGEVEVEAPTRKIEVVVNGDCRRRLEPVPAYRGVDEQPDVIRPNAGGLDGLGPRGRSGVGEEITLRPPASLPDAGE